MRPKAEPRVIECVLSDYTVGSIGCGRYRGRRPSLRKVERGRQRGRNPRRRSLKVGIGIGTVRMTSRILG